ncbi:MAG: hypothetical protein IJ189_00930, partial [Clostridia bacterium]|nr:hypothetical protein [Clostridia bacterium]
MVLSVENNQALLFSQWILDDQQVVYATTKSQQTSRKYRRINDFTESDLYVWMNETMLATLLGGNEMMNALVETKYGLLYPLTDEQMLTTAYGFRSDRYFDHPERQCKATPYARNVKLYSWSRRLSVDAKLGTTPYWVIAFRNPKTMNTNYMMQVCGGNGHLSYGAYARTDVGVRPALTLDLNKCVIAAGSGTSGDPFVLEYTGSAQ